MDKLTSILSKEAEARCIDHIINKIANLFLIVSRVRKYTAQIKIHRTKRFTTRMSRNFQKSRTSKNTQLLTLPRNKNQKEFFRIGSIVTRFRLDNQHQTHRYKIQQSYLRRKLLNRRLFSLRTNERQVNISWENRQAKVHSEK